MVFVLLVMLGLCLGSFVNALVWRLHEQEGLRAKGKGLSRGKLNHEALSISRGRSMCPECHHELAAKDLVPVFSWLSLKGKCRYCHKPISEQYPLVELATAALFIISYCYWPLAVSGWQAVAFGVWLSILVGFMALIVYDLRWFMLPDKIVLPVTILAILELVVRLVDGGNWSTLLGSLEGALAISGTFYLLFQLSKGKWIGGGDVKLGVALGLLAGSALRGFLVIFIASTLGTIIALPLLLLGKAERTSKLPFGPMLIAGCIIVVLFGQAIIDTYRSFIGI